MLLSMMRAKLHSVTVTGCDVDYEGSIAIDEDLLEASGLLVNEEVHVWNVTSGSRIVTYIIPGKRGSGEIALNGAAAHHFNIGDKAIIASFCQLTMEEARRHETCVVIADDDNKVKEIR